MQLLCSYSEEGDTPGLDFVKASVEKLQVSDSADLKIPHMGWNTVVSIKQIHYYLI